MNVIKNNKTGVDPLKMVKILFKKMKVTFTFICLIPVFLILFACKKENTNSINEISVIRDIKSNF
jgi:hypothetical protein